MLIFDALTSANEINACVYLHLLLGTERKIWILWLEKQEWMACYGYTNV